VLGAMSSASGGRQPTMKAKNLADRYHLPEL